MVQIPTARSLSLQQPHTRAHSRTLTLAHAHERTRSRRTDAHAACPYGGGAFTTLTGTIAIPPAYASNVVCEYRITTGAPIYLRFDSFATEATYDTVKVYDGTSAAGALKGSFSGPTIPPVQLATSGSMFIRFSSDASAGSSGVTMTWSGSVLTPTTASPNSNRADPAGTHVPRSCIALRGYQVLLHGLVLRWFCVRHWSP
jgi:hypothetical protein